MKQYLKLLRESYPLKNPMPTETILHELLHLPEESLEGVKHGINTIIKLIIK